MTYNESFKKSQVKQVPGGYEKIIECSKVTKVENENGDLLKFKFDRNEGVLTILESNFKLLNITYND